MLLVDHLLAAVLALVYPAYGAWSFPVFAAAVRAGAPGARLREYRLTLAQLGGLALVALAIWAWQGRTAASFRLTAEAGTGLLVACALTAAAILLLGLQVLGVARDARTREQVEKQLAAAGGTELLPTGPRELRLFLVLGIVGGGVCEEILFRGYLLWYFEELTSLAGAVALSSAAFGLMHAYQGIQGMIKTAILGLIFAGLTVLAGTLWPAVALHAAVDVHAALLARLTWDSAPGEGADPGPPRASTGP